MSIARWSGALRAANSSEHVIEIWKTLRTAVANHQQLLLDNGIGKEVSERDRLRVNARRVGLEAPMFADEAEATFADVMANAFAKRAQLQEEKKASEL